MKASAVYRKAAEMLFDGVSRYSCICLWQAGASESLREKYIDKMGFNTQTELQHAINDACGVDSYEMKRSLRAMLLLLMSEIAKDEE